MSAAFLETLQQILSYPLIFGSLNQPVNKFDQLKKKGKKKKKELGCSLIDVLHAGFLKFLVKFETLVIE